MKNTTRGFLPLTHTHSLSLSLSVCVCLFMSDFVHIKKAQRSRCSPSREGDIQIAINGWIFSMGLGISRVQPIVCVGLEIIGASKIVQGLGLIDERLPCCEQYPA